MPFVANARMYSIAPAAVPAGTPADIIRRLHGEIVKMLQQPEMREKLVGIGATAVGNTPEELGALIRTESARYADVVKRANIRAE